MVTLDAVIVNVALPDIRRELAGGMSGLQWVVDGYTLMFAALLLSSGSLSDRLGVRRAFGAGMLVFVIASAACGLAPTLGLLLVARFVQGAAAAALGLLGRTARSPDHDVPFDWAGQVTAVLGMGGLTYAAIETGVAGITTPRVLVAFAVAVVALAAFVMSLYLQQLRGLSALGTGIVFLPMMATGAVLTPFIARLAERFGARAMVTSGLICMTAGLIVISQLPASAPVSVVSALMMLVGVAGPLVMPPAMALLLHTVHARQAGVASGVFNASRQAGGALAIAVFGALLTDRATFLHGLRMSLLIAAAVALAAAAVSRLLSHPGRTPQAEGGATA